MLRGLFVHRLAPLVAPALAVSGGLATPQNPPATCAPAAEVLSISGGLAMLQNPPATTASAAEALSKLFIFGDGMHSALKGGPRPNKKEKLVMARDFLTTQAEPLKIVQANPTAVVDLQQIGKVLWEVDEVTVSLDCPGYPFSFPTLNSLILDSWVRNNKHVVYKEDHMHLLDDKDLELNQRLRLGIRGEDGTLCTSVAVSAWLGLKIAGERTGTEVSLIADGTPAHSQLVDFGKGSHAIDPQCRFAVYYLKEALETRRAALILGDGNMQALTRLITELGLHVVQLPSKAIASVVPDYPSNYGAEYYGMQGFNVAALIRDPKTKKQLMVMTSMQLGSTIANPSTIHRAANMTLPFFEHWLRAFVLLAGGEPATLPPFVDYDRSELGALLMKEGAADFDKVLHDKGLLPKGETYICSNARGGTILTTVLLVTKYPLTEIVLTAYYSHPGKANSLKKERLEKELQDKDLSDGARKLLEEQLQELKERMATGGTIQLLTSTHLPR